MTSEDDRSAGCFAYSVALAGCSHPQPVVYVASPPPEFGPVAQQGYHDGSGRPTRHSLRFCSRPPAPSHVPQSAIGPPEEYRRGFRAGYEATFRGGPPPRDIEGTTAQIHEKIEFSGPE